MQGTEAKVIIGAVGFGLQLRDITNQTLPKGYGYRYKMEHKTKSEDSGVRRPYVKED